MFLVFFPSEMCQIGGSCCCVYPIFLVLEMLILSKFEEKGKEDVETFNYRLVVGQLMNWYIQNGTHNPRIILRTNINFSPWELKVFYGLFHLWIHFLHKSVKIRHLFRIVYSRWWSGFVQILDIIYPS